MVVIVFEARNSRIFHIVTLLCYPSANYTVIPLFSVVLFTGTENNNPCRTLHGKGYFGFAIFIQRIDR